MALTIRTLGVLAVAATLAACGTTPAERGVTGAVAGAAIARATDGDLTDGALYGAAAGAFLPCIGAQAGYTTGGNCY